MAIVVNVEKGIGISGHIYCPQAIAESRGNLRQTVTVVQPKTRVDADEVLRAFGVVASIMGFAQEQERQLYAHTIHVILQVLHLCGVENLPNAEKIAFVDFTMDISGDLKVEFKHFDPKAGGTSLPNPNLMMNTAGHA